MDQDITQQFRAMVEQRCICSLAMAMLLALPVVGQPWGFNGSQWWHSYNNGSGTFGYAYAVAEADTLIDGVSWTRIAANVSAWNVPSQYDHQEVLDPIHARLAGDAVLVLNEGAQDTLYHFGALPGTFWNAPEWVSGIRYVVTDTGNMVVDAIPLRWSEVDVFIGTGDEQLFMVDTLVERFGFLHQYMDPTYTLSLNPYVTDLRCYTDPDLTFTTDVAPSCDFTVPVADLTQAPPGPIVHPNPGSDQVTIALPRTERHSLLRVLDATGREVMRHRFTQPHLQLDVSGLVQGSYLLEFSGQLAAKVTIKWIKQ